MEYGIKEERTPRKKERAQKPRPSLGGDRRGAGRSRHQGMKTRGGLVRDGFQNRAELPEHSDAARMVVSSVESCHEMSSI